MARKQTGETFRPFLYCGGKPPFDGIRDFLKSRGIRVPEGAFDHLRRLIGRT